jgi:hypothetical protein
LELRRLRRLNRRARAEVAKLLRRSKAGTITRRQLQAGLEEVAEDLVVLGFHYFRL